ncbi:MAG: class I adenylate-forming enzyme family protein [Jhaorihella sp.]
MPDLLAQQLRNWEPPVSFTRQVMLNAQRMPRRDAIVFDGRTMSYGALASRVRRLMRGLDKLRVRQNEIVTLLASNHPDMLVAYLAILGVGAIPAPINYRLRVEDMRYIVENCDSRTLIVDTAHLELLPQIAGSVEHVLVIGDNAGLPLPSGAIPLDRAVSREDDGPCDMIRSHSMSLLHTSGTTGRPKGALRSKWGMEERALEQGFRPNDRMLCVMPVCLSAGYGYTLLPLYLGATAYLEKEVDEDRILDLIGREGITSTFMIPSILQRVMDHPGIGALNDVALRTLQSGAGPVPMDLREAVTDRFGPVLGIYAGSTETGPYANYGGRDILRKSEGNCIGRPFFGVEICLVGEDGAPVNPGETGEIAVRSHLNFSGYWREPELTAETSLNGMVGVGDLGRFDDEGFLYLVGRKRDVIKSGGINVPAAQVESVIERHPAVAEVACIGLPDRQFTEVICAAIVLKPGARLDLADLQTFCSDSLSRFQLPRRLVLLGQLPRNLTGRVIKDELRNMIEKDFEESQTHD